MATTRAGAKQAPERPAPRRRVQPPPELVRRPPGPDATVALQAVAQVARDHLATPGAGSQSQGSPGDPGEKQAHQAHCVGFEGCGAPHLHDELPGDDNQDFALTLHLARAKWGPGMEPTIRPRT
jgi:hypothetical protein